MKTMGRLSIVTIVLLLSAGLYSIAQAEPKPGKKHSNLLINEDEERYVMVTGSLIPQRVKLKSIGTNTPYNVRIYTQRELLSTGRQTTGGALAALDPAITLHGR